MEKIWAWDNDLSRFTERPAWSIYRSARWGGPATRAKCTSCKSDIRKTSLRKAGNQFIYQCVECGKRFTDLTDTPFHKSRLPMTSLLFLTVLLADGIPKKEIARILKVDNKTIIRLAGQINGSPLCVKLVDDLAAKGITAERIKAHLKPEEVQNVGSPMSAGREASRTGQYLSHEDYLKSVPNDATCIHGRPAGCPICDGEDYEYEYVRVKTGYVCPRCKKNVLAYTKPRSCKDHD